MGSLIIAFVLTFIVTATCSQTIQDFHCEFESQNYKVKRTAVHQSDYVWGSRVEPRVYESKEELLEAKRSLDAYKAGIYNTTVLDNFETFMRAYSAMKQVVKLNVRSFDASHMKDLNLIREFLKTYEIGGSKSDNLGLLVNFLKAIAVNGLENHYFIGVAGGTVRDIYEIKFGHWLVPTQPLARESILGLIKVSVGGKTGYVIMNMEYPGKETPLVMEDDVIPKSLPLNDEYPYENLMPEKYGLIGADQSFIQVVRFKYDPNGKVFLPHENDVIYVGRPLCNFVETHVRSTLLNTDALSMVKYVDIGNEFFTDVYFYAYLQPEPRQDIFEMAYLVDVEGQWMFDKVDAKSYAQIASSDAETQEWFDTIANRLGLPKEYIEQKMNEFEKFYKENFLTKKITFQWSPTKYY